MFETIGIGTRRELRDDDVFDVLHSLQSKNIGDRFELEWKKELKKKKPSLLCAMFRMFAVRYFSLSIFIFIYETSLVIVLEPILIGKITSYFEAGKNMTIREGFSYTVALAGSSVLLCLCNNIFLIHLHIICLQMQIAVTSLIYRKSLKLRVDVSSGFIGGRAVNLITKDVAPFFHAADCAQMLIVGMPQLVVMLIVAYNQIGLAALSGASIILILIPINS
ncbi:hypothetical protein FQR65_LT10876 [Abscondita terminalis]|nr:hypothetical protein FQR65_LT10876 [Abscondita terminalis]